jgi:hypothetical protein
MSTEPNQDSAFERLLEKALQHAETRWEYLSLTATEKISGAAAAFAGVLIISTSMLIVLFFFSIGFAIWLGDYLGHRAGGFALAGLIFLPLAAAGYYFVPPFVRAKIIQSMLQNDDAQDQN